MRNNPIPSIVLAAALGACGVQPELLNSERIQQRFGSYGVEVLQQDDGVRRSNLYSVDNGVRVCRTYALVKFIVPVNAELSATHKAVVGGQSIGTSFSTAGWRIRKETIFVGSMRLPGPQHAIARLMHLDDAASLGLHAYRLILRKGAQTVYYATIIESHHPHYITETELSELYAEAMSAHLDSAEIDALVELVLN